MYEHKQLTWKQIYIYEECIQKKKKNIYARGNTITSLSDEMLSRFSV